MVTYLDKKKVVSNYNKQTTSYLLYICGKKERGILTEFDSIQCFQNLRLCQFYGDFLFFPKITLAICPAVCLWLKRGLFFNTEPYGSSP